MEGIETFVSECLDKVKELEEFYLSDEAMFEIPIDCIDDDCKENILKLLSMSNKELNTEWCLEKANSFVYVRLIVPYVPALEKTSVQISANAIQDKGVQRILSELLDDAYNIGDNMVGCRCISRMSDGNFAVRNVIVDLGDDFEYDEYDD